MHNTVDFLSPTVTISSSTTTVNISLAQPSGTYPVVQYEISLSRFTGEGQLLCDSVVDNRSMITSNTSIGYSGLHEFSNYTVSVTATILNRTKTSTVYFSTLSSGMQIIVALHCY